MAPTTRFAARAGTMRTSADWYERWRGGDLHNANGWGANSGEIGDDVAFYWFRVLISEEEFTWRRMRSTQAGPYMKIGHRPLFGWAGAHYWGGDFGKFP